MGLLGEIYSFGNRTRNRLKGLLDDPKGYIQQTADQTANTLRDMTGANETAQQFALRDKINAGDKNALAQYRNLEKTIQNKLFDVALNFNPAAVGMTAWHGSPHKFDKFDLAKIGTGEGAQAYGHGAYLAEAKDVGKEYQLALGNKPSAVDDFAGFEAQAAFAKHGGNTKKAIAWLEDRKKLTDDAKQFLMPGAYEKQIGVYNEAIRRIQSGEVSKEAGYLYKTDIPDEAVARFLDWDKPLSQQGEKAQDVLRQYHELNGGQGYMSDSGYVAIGKGASDAMTGADLYRYLGEIGSGKEDAAKLLEMHGFPGIRYLDGGSRAAGQGSSNFVVFDPNMIRILERNGEATGAQPWKPGEWGGLLK